MTSSDARPSTYVFLGPSLPLDEARAILPSAIYLPPVAMGDMFRLIRKKPKVVAIIDGFFEQVPSVWHKEILFAMESGARVLGASSMGALRAAELHPFGMEGVGKIFEAFRSGEIEDDDEVAVVHGPAADGYRCLSEAMVNVRDALERAEREEAISAQTRESLTAIAKSIFYPERSWDAILSAGADAELPAPELERLRGFVRRVRPNLKRDDAVALLERLRTEPASETRAAPGFQLEKTAFWLKMTEVVNQVDAELPTGDGANNFEALRDHVRVTAPDFPDVRRGCLLLLLVEREASRLGLRVSGRRLQEAAERFRRARGLLSIAATNGWMEANRLDRAGLSRLVELEALCDELLAHYAAESGTFLAPELRRRGAFPDAWRTMTAKKHHLRETGIINPTFEDAGADYAQILAWYESRFRKMEGGLELHAKELGFESSRVFFAEVLEQFIFEKSLSPGDGDGKP
ncbi:MAG TPA: TfuA-like protein [Polyangia bacterium]